MLFQRFTTLLLVCCSLTAIGLAGCSQEAGKNPSTAAASGDAAADETISDETPTERRPSGISTAMKAKDALFQRLSARLVEEMSASGPAAAIQVCSSEAQTIAKNVGEEFGVRIGRTSFKLRNQENKPPNWASPFIQERSKKPEYLVLESGETGVLLPILLQPQCTVCHGEKDSIAPDVQAKLAELYPDDSATGFQAGDLRGWFWVEVPSA